MIMKAKIILAFSTASLLSCSTYNKNVSVENTPKYLNIANEAFRKSGAPNVDILRIGIKKDGIFQPDSMPILKQDIPIYLSTEAFSETTEKAALDLGAKTGIGIANGNIGMTNSTTGSIKGSYKVMAIRDMDRLLAELNAPYNAKLLDRIAGYDEPRIVVAIAVAFGYDFQLDANATVNVNLSIPTLNAAPEIKFGGNRGNTSIVRLSDGTTFAYKLARLCWKEIQDGKLFVTAIDVDQPSKKSDNHCPEGSFKNAIALREEKEIELLSSINPSVR